jgi:two-component system nitrogen regulation sensor histidine kinase NtrY
MQRVKRYYLLLLALLSTVVFSWYYFTVFSTNYSTPIGKVKTEFLKKEKALDRFLEFKKNEVQTKGIGFLWSNLKDDNSPNLHIYSTDSLVFWNTNQLPIMRFADIHFPSDGILHLQNGWYYAKIIQEDNFTICASYLIKHDYSYENKDLINDFSEPFKLPFGTYITLEQETGYPIFSSDKKFLFSIVPNDYQTASTLESNILLVVLLIAISFWLIALGKWHTRHNTPWHWLLFLGIICLRAISIKFIWFGFMHDTAAFHSSLYGTNEWFPNFAEYLINCLFIAYSFYFLGLKLTKIKPTVRNQFVGILLFLGIFPLWSALLFLMKGLIENSSIPLVIDKLFSLNFYSLSAIISIGLLLLTYFGIVRDVISCAKKAGVTAANMAAITFLGGVIYFFIEIYVGYEMFFSALFPMVFSAYILYGLYREKGSNQFGLRLGFLFLFSLITALNLGNFNRSKERSERELYANQLATDQDIVTEVEYRNMVEAVKQDYFLHKFIASPRRIGISEFEDGLERRLFHGFWERYEMGFNLFDANHQSLINYKKDVTGGYDELNGIITEHGLKSEIDSNIFFITDYTGAYSYIIRQEIYTKDSIQATLFCMLKSKKIPEEIGFPRLLISSKAKVFESLENYSIAKYYDSRLVTKYGKFNYPTSEKALANWKEVRTGYYNNDGYNHYVLCKTAKDVIVLSSENFTWIELVTSFSYLFSFYGILILPVFFSYNTSRFMRKTLTLSVKIQIVLISLVFISLVTFGWGSGVFVRNQYNEYTNEVISEKLKSVEEELTSKLGNQNLLSIPEHGNYMEFLLEKLSKVFVTDINFYDKQGYMLATSRPKVFNMGLLSEQMNPQALYAVDVKDKSEFIHQENIGELNYASAYIPFYNTNGTLLGYLNLQHFGQQKESENQIQQFLVAIINVFMLLLAISIVVAVVVSNWVTSPLRLLQQSFSQVRFGKHNQQILYDNDDEIGSLVKDYNRKLEELELAAHQLAQSERESAWREMAKQVAHEIKNPLTPMKLSIQQLQRVYDPNDPSSKLKLDKVSNSIVEQIDALTKIANEFSNFAKMPRPNETRIDVLPLLENVIEMFKQEEHIVLCLNTELTRIELMADKDLIMRVFNNLIKNAMQAIPDSRNGVVEIGVVKEGTNFVFSFTDNGVGIPDDMRSSIFVPYFTTKGTGTGLGLAMVKQIIENHKGTIWFESDERGTHFFFTLPAVD